MLNKLTLLYIRVIVILKLLIYLERNYISPTKYSSNEFRFNRQKGLIGGGAYSKVLQCYHDNLETVAVKCYHIHGNTKEVNKSLEK